MNRRDLLKLLGVGAVAVQDQARLLASPGDVAVKSKPIDGSWISILWDDKRHFYWNDACAKFTAAQWDYAVKEVAEIGMQYLVLLGIAKGGKAFYDTPLLPKAKELVCKNPIEALLSAADKYGVKFFLSCDWYGSWHGPDTLNQPEAVRPRLQMMGEIADQYGHHKSFYGWYWANEAYLTPYFVPEFVEYINTCSGEAHQLMPQAKTLTAPYHTYKAVCDDRFIGQLERLDVDIIAYQDEVGCLRMTPEQSAIAFATLRLAHDKVPQRALWADVETFAWEGKPDSQESPLIPAPFARIEEQLEAVGPYVDKVLIYQYQGIMNKPGSEAPAGHPDSNKLYLEYIRWLKENHPHMLRLNRRWTDP
jgi:hypothetical protein